MCQSLVAIGRYVSQILEQVFVNGQNNSVGHPFPFAWTARRWARIEVTYDTQAAKITVGIDGRVVLSEPTRTVCPYAPSPASIRVGIFCMDPQTSTRRVRIDDVTFDAF